MFRFIGIIAFLALAAVISADKLQTRVLHGIPAREGQFPYQISLRLNGRHHCGGTIIAKNAVITAAHCVYQQTPQTLTVVAGTIYLNSGGVLAHVSVIVAHPYYNPQSYNNDIAILYLVEQLPVGSNPNIGFLPMISETELLVADKYATLSGWGQDSPNYPQIYPGWVILPPRPPEVLKYAKIPLWDLNTCAAVTHGRLTAGMFCAGDAHGRITSCPGDSGGPLVKDGKLVGVVSWGFGCGADAPAIFTHLSAYRSWIRSIVKF